MTRISTFDDWIGTGGNQRAEEFFHMFTGNTAICSPRRNMRNIFPRRFPTPRTSAS